MKPDRRPSRPLPPANAAPEPARTTPRLEGPLPNYTLSTECPSCGAPTVRHACKVRCGRCGFMWDCSEL